jgi:hypothetical protein
MALTKFGRRTFTYVAISFLNCFKDKCDLILNDYKVWLIHNIHDAYKDFSKIVINTDVETKMFVRMKKKIKKSG